MNRSVRAALAGTLVAVGLLASSCAPEPALSDADLNLELVARLEALGAAWDPRLYVLEVRATAASGEVTLAGFVDRVKAEELVQAVDAVPGVHRVVDQTIKLPDPGLGDRTAGLVAVAVANLGDGPGQDQGQHLVTQARLGDPVELLRERDGWYQVRMIEDGYLGWVGRACVERMTPGEVETYLAGAQILVTAKMTPLLAAESGSELVRAVMGTILPVIGAGAVDQPGEAPGGAGPAGDTGVQAPWVTVRLPDGTAARVAQSDVRFLESAVAVFAEARPASEILVVARQFVGLPYLWGGTTAHGFDCSGFVQFVFAMNGYQLPRDADMQFAAGEAVADRGDLRPGDLVFFSTYKPGPSHIGIYLGESRYIHSSSAGVTVNSFDPTAADYNATLDQAYYGARRVVGTGP